MLYEATTACVCRMPERPDLEQRLLRPPSHGGAMVGSSRRAGGRLSTAYSMPTLQNLGLTSSAAPRGARGSSNVPVMPPDLARRMRGARRFICGGSVAVARFIRVLVVLLVIVDLGGAAAAGPGARVGRDRGGT